MENKDLGENLLSKENPEGIENKDVGKIEGYAINVMKLDKETELEKIEEPNVEKNLLNLSDLKMTPGKIQILVGSEEWEYTADPVTPSYPETQMYSKHLMFLFVGIMILVNILTVSIIYDRSNMKSNYKYFKAPFFISYFFYLLTMMGSIMLLVYPIKYMRYFNKKINFLAYFFVLCFYIAAAVELSISELPQLFIIQLYISRFFVIGVLVIVAYAFDISTAKSAFFGIIFAVLESYFYVDPFVFYYEYTVRTVVFIITNINFIKLINDFNIFRDPKFTKNRFLFIVFSLSLVANGGVLNFIYDLSLQLLIGKF